MGTTRILNLHSLRWFFQLMGNRSCIMPTCPLPEETSGPKSRTRAIKLIRADGIVKIYYQPIKASELLLEFPRHRICNSDSFYIGQKIPALSQNDKLKPGNSYFVLPNHLFEIVLSFVSITSFLASKGQTDRHFRKAILKCQPFHIQKTPSGILQVNVSEEFISRLMDGNKDDDDDEDKLLLCTTKELKKDYAQLVGVRQWKPKLETIKEKREKKKKVKIGPFSATKKRSKTSILVPKSRNLGQSSSSSLSIDLSPNPVSKNKMKGFLGKRKKSKQKGYDFITEKI